MSGAEFAAQDLARGEPRDLVDEHDLGDPFVARQGFRDEGAQRVGRARPAEDPPGMLRPPTRFPK